MMGQVIIIEFQMSTHNCRIYITFYQIYFIFKLLMLCRIIKSWISLMLIFIYVPLYINYLSLMLFKNFKTLILTPPAYALI